MAACGFPAAENSHVDSVGVVLIANFEGHGIPHGRHDCAFATQVLPDVLTVLLGAPVAPETVSESPNAAQKRQQQHDDQVLDVLQRCLSHFECVLIRLVVVLFFLFRRVDCVLVVILVSSIHHNIIVRHFNN